MKKSSIRGLNKSKLVYKELENIQKFGYNFSTIFSDWLDLIFYENLSITDNILRRIEFGSYGGKYEERYLSAVGKYRENIKDKNIGNRPVDYMLNSYALLVKNTILYKEDILGELYEVMVTHSENGQFFTPYCIVDLMAKMLNNKNTETVNDPCCGSGRFLISSGLLDPGNKLTGTDVDIRCVKMTLINMIIFKFNSIIFWGNSLSNEIYREYRTNNGFIIEVK